MGKTRSFLHVKGNETQNIKLFGNDFSTADKIKELSEGAINEEINIK